MLYKDDSVNFPRLFPRVPIHPLSLPFSKLGKGTIDQKNIFENLVNSLSHSYISWEYGLPWWLSGKEPTCQCRRCRFPPWVGKTPWRRKWQPTPIFLPGEVRVWRSLEGCSPWGHQRVGRDWESINNNNYLGVLRWWQWQPTPVLSPGKSMDGGAWWAAVHGVAKSRTRLSDFPFTFHFHALEKEMATHCSVLAWRIPGTAEPGGLPSMGSHRVGHDWSDLALALRWYANSHFRIFYFSF